MKTYLYMSADDETWELVATNDVDQFPTMKSVDNPVSYRIVVRGDDGAVTDLLEGYWREGNND